MRRVLIGCLTILLMAAPDASAAPPAPGQLQAVVSGATVTLTWIRPGETELTGYVVEAGFAPGLSNAATLRVDHQSLVVNAVPRGTYYVRVRATDREGISPPSNEVEVVVTEGVIPCLTPPQRPDGFRVKVSDQEGIAFAWNPPLDHCTPSKYMVLVGSAPGLTNQAAFAVEPTTEFDFDVPVGTYYVRIAAINDYGSSPESNEVVVVWSCGAAPGPPQSLNGVVSGSTVMLSWARPTTGCAPKQYELHAGTAPGLTNAGVYPMGTSLGFAGPAPSGTYYVRVVARNAAGVGSASNEVQLIVP